MLEELRSRNQQLESRLKEHIKEIDSLRAEHAICSSRLAETENEKDKKWSDERQQLLDELMQKEAYYHEVMSELTDKHKEQAELQRNEIERLRAELKDCHQTAVAKTTEEDGGNQRSKAESEQLRKQLDELKYAYDDLLDEKSQLFTSLSELKQQKSSSLSNDTEIARLNSVIKVKHTYFQTVLLLMNLTSALAIGINYKPFNYLNNYQVKKKFSMHGRL